MRVKRSEVQVNTEGETQPVTFDGIQERVNNLKFLRRVNRPVSGTWKSVNREKVNMVNLNLHQGYRLPSFQDDLETDKQSTNFNIKQSALATINERVKSAVRSRLGGRRSVQVTPVQQKFKRPHTSNKKSFVISKSLHVARQEATKSQNQIASKGEPPATIYKRQMQQFQRLYQHLARILSSIREESIETMEAAIADYIAYIQAKYISFVDEFTEGRDFKLQKLIRVSRLHESLSIAYLFLEIAQKRAQDHESDLVNFLGYCLSNLLITARIYSLLQGHEEFQESQFEQAMKKVQISSFGQRLTRIDDVLLRLQHNNQIITMFHKRLGRFNLKFELCIQMFLKSAERDKKPCAQCTHEIFEYLALHIHQSKLVGISRTLQTAPMPYCSPATKKYTLVIQPLGILFTDGQSRPYLTQFLSWTHKYFQLIFWTWEMPYEEEISRIMDSLEEYATSKLYRYHCIEEAGVYIKDIARLGRSIEHTLILDYDKRIFAKQPCNGIELRWKPNPKKSKDKGLPHICQILQQMLQNSLEVKDTLQIYADQLYKIKGYSVRDNFRDRSSQIGEY